MELHDNQTNILSFPPQIPEFSQSNKIVPKAQGASTDAQLPTVAKCAACHAPVRPLGLREVGGKACLFDLLRGRAIHHRFLPQLWSAATILN